MSFVLASACCGRQYLDVSPIPLPTDNLYKFLALTGVVIVGASVYFVFPLVDELVSKSEKVTMMLKQARVESDYWDTIGTRHQDTIDRALGKKPQEEGKIIATISPEELEKQVKISMEAVKNQRLKLEEIAMLNGQIPRLAAHVQRMILISRIGSVVGVLLAVFGFYRWWGIQQLQDQLLRTEAAKSG